MWYNRQALVDGHTAYKRRGGRLVYIYTCKPKGWGLIRTQERPDLPGRRNVAAVDIVVAVRKLKVTRVAPGKIETYGRVNWRQNGNRDCVRCSIRWRETAHRNNALQMGHATK